MPKTMKILMSSLAMTVALGTFNMVQAADVEVDFSGRLQSNMGALNEIEREKEKSFREYNDSNAGQRGRSSQYLEVTKLDNVKWANEAFFADADDYSVEQLIIKMTSEALNRAGMGNLEGTIRFSIKTIKVANHPLSALRGADSYVIGTVEHVSASGKVLASSNVSANYFANVSVNASYDGPDFAFFSTDSVDRVGPTLARFIQKSLERLFPDKDFSGPVVVG